MSQTLFDRVLFVALACCDVKETAIPCWLLIAPIIMSDIAFKLFFIRLVDLSP